MPINLPINQSIIVGKEGHQAITISDPTVSRRHCQITRLDSNLFMLEDLGSTNGTTASGLPVVRTRVAADTPLMLGHFQTTVGDLLGIQISKPIPTPGMAPQPAATQKKTVHIAHLGVIYENFRTQTSEINKTRSRAQFKRMMMMSCGPIVGSMAGCFGAPPAVTALVGVFASAGLLGYTMMLSSQGDQLVDEASDLNKQFQIDYVCPECKNFLGANRPLEALLNKGECPFCHSKFVK